MKPIVGAARYLIIVAVICCLIVATALLAFGAIDTFYIVRKAFLTADISKAGKQLLLDSIELADLLLLATVVYIIAVGLYELFIDDTVAVPKWLEIHSLDDLKDKLIGVLVVVLAVGFLGQFIAWDGQTNLLISGGGAALMIGTLTAFLFFKPKKQKKDDDGATE